MIFYTLDTYNMCSNWVLFLYQHYHTVKGFFLHFVLIFKQNNKLIILLCNLFLTVDDLFFSWGILFSYYLLFI